MKSFCIKTNNKKVIDYLLNGIEDINIDNIYFVNKSFKLYENVILHYTGDNLNTFLGELTNLITNCILIYFEPYLIRRLINFNYFYFDDFEKKIIEDNCYNYIMSNEDESIKFRKNEIWNSVSKYICENKSVILDGFINFRLQEYINSLDYIVDNCVNEYIIEKEYSEFINLLKFYIESKESETKLVHLVYTNGDSILLDSKKHVIPLDDKKFNAKYLSDISFSSNDYALNALLTLLPQKIEIHVIGYEDEFINTLKLIFGSRISICTDCNICKTYRVLNNVK